MLCQKTNIRIVLLKSKDKPQKANSDDNLVSLARREGMNCFPPTSAPCPGWVPPPRCIKCSWHVYDCRTFQLSLIFSHPRKSNRLYKSARQLCVYKKQLLILKRIWYNRSTCDRPLMLQTDDSFRLSPFKLRPSHQSSLMASLQNSSFFPSWGFTWPTTKPSRSA